MVCVEIFPQLTFNDWKEHLKIIYSTPLILRKTNDCLAGINRFSFGQEADQGMVYLATALVNQARKNCWA